MGNDMGTQHFSTTTLLACFNQIEEQMEGEETRMALSAANTRAFEAPCFNLHLVS